MLDIKHHQTSSSSGSEQLPEKVQARLSISLELLSGCLCLVSDLSAQRSKARSIVESWKRHSQHSPPLRQLQRSISRDLSLAFGVWSTSCLPQLTSQIFSFLPITLKLSIQFNKHLEETERLRRLIPNQIWGNLKQVGTSTSLPALPR